MLRKWWAGLGGSGGDDAFFSLAHTCDMLRTWHFLHLHTCDMLRKSWGGLGGWGGDDDVSITCTHVTCYALDVSCNKAWKSESKCRSVKFASVSHNKMQFTKWHSKTRLTGTQALDKVEWSFFPVLPTSQSKIAKIELRTQFWKVFYTWVKIQNRKNEGISNDFDMTHVARNANYQGSLTTPVPCFFCLFSLCVFSLCFLCVFSLCFLSVFFVCVFSLCFLSVFSLSLYVFCLCFLSGFAFYRATKNDAFLSINVDIILLLSGIAAGQLWSTDKYYQELVVSSFAANLTAKYWNTLTSYFGLSGYSVFSFMLQCFLITAFSERLPSGF